MNADPLGRVALRIEHAAVLTLDPELCHGSAHTDGRSLKAGRMRWPSQRCLFRIEEHSSQLKPRSPMYEVDCWLSIEIVVSGAQRIGVMSCDGELKTFANVRRGRVLDVDHAPRHGCHHSG